ncbi:MAG TPA: serine hydrolase domain-containing protein, partial [Acidimicrobiales bacterium]|nr:serine hydrolase domain-containing protein [Acidimicrobiales bacterium]
LWGGTDVCPDDLVGVFSSTKGVSAIAIALLVQRGQIDLDAPVSRYWPQFAAGGKGAVTVRLALSHQAGVAGVEPQLSSLTEFLDHATVAARVAAQVPQWRPGAACGYHGNTIGTIMDELCRRITGISIAQFFREEIADPRAIDFFISTPEEAEARVKPLLPAPAPSPRPEADSLSGLSQNLAGFHKDASFDIDVPLPNVRQVRAAGQAALSGVSSARGMARVYATCFGEVDGFPPLLSPETVALVSQIQTVGDDLILGYPARYAIVFQKPHDGYQIGSWQAFGHGGAGGSIGVADPLHNLAYAWIPRRMTVPGGADPRGLLLAKLIRACAARAAAQVGQ